MRQIKNEREIQTDHRVKEGKTVRKELRRPAIAKQVIVNAVLKGCETGKQW